MEKTKMILKYLDGNMDRKESEQYEDLIKRNKDLESELRLFREVNAAIMEEDVPQFRHLLKELVRQENKIRSPKRRILNRFLKIPAAAVLLILIGTGIWHFGRKDAATRLYQEFYSPYQSYFVTRSPGLSPGKFEEARDLYRQSRYREANIILQDYLVVHPDHTEAHFYHALSALALNNPESIMEELQQIEARMNSPFALHARWYLALAYLKSGDLQKAKYYLALLTREENMYTTQAKKLKRRL